LRFDISLNVQALAKTLTLIISLFIFNRLESI
jgi:hypothetical protein